jgi:hypothetical protein
MSARTSYPRVHGGGPEDVEVGDISLLISFSVDGEYTSDAFSEPRGSFLPPSVAILMGGYWGMSRIDPRDRPIGQHIQDRVSEPWRTPVL